VQGGRQNQMEDRSRDAKIEENMKKDAGGARYTKERKIEKKKRTTNSRKM